MKRMAIRPEQPPYPPDSFCTRTQIAGLWVDWHTDGGEPTEAEVLEIASPSPAAINAIHRAEAVAMIETKKDAFAKGLRAGFDAARDSDNAIRKWLMDFKAEVAAATNLANLKSRVAALGDLPQITAQQIINAIKARINDGTVN